MLSTNEKITLRQLQILIILGAMGTGVIVLPRRVAEFAGQDGWVIVVGLTVVAMVLGWLVSTAVSAAARAKPGAGFIETTGYLLTKPVAYICGLVLWAKLTVSAGLELRVFLNITGDVLLPNTPVLVVSGVMLAVCAYAAAKGIETRARVGEILLYLMVVPFLFLIVVALMDIDFSNLQPLLVTPANTLAYGTFRLGFMFTGLETLLLIAPFLTFRRGGLGRSVAGAIGFSGVIITIITILTIAKFGQNVINQPLPVLRMMDMLHLPGSFIERQDALMFSFWIITCFVLVNALLFFGGVLVKDMFKFRSGAKLQKGVIVTAVAVFGVTAIPLEESAVYHGLDFMYFTLGIFYLVLLPLFLLIAVKIDSWAKERGVNMGEKAMRGLSLILVFAFVATSLTACWDKVEIENRAFVVAMGIDKAEEEPDRFAVTLSIPLPKADDDKSDDDEEPKHIKSASGATLVEALKKLDVKTDKTLYYGQGKLLVLGDELLKDKELVKSVMNTINNKSEIDRRINVLASKDKASKILEIKPPGETMSGMYVAEMYKDKNKIAGASLILDFEGLNTAMTYQNGAIIPRIEHEVRGLKLNGTVVMKDHEKIGTLTHDELRGFLWTFPDGGESAVVTAPSNEDSPRPISMNVEKHRAKVRFEPVTPPLFSEYVHPDLQTLYEAGGNFRGNESQNLRAVIEVQVEGRIDESTYSQSNPPSPAKAEQIKKSLANQIAKEISATAARLQDEFAMDGYNWLETLRKKNYPLYQIYSPHWAYAFVEMEIIPQVSVDVIW